MKPPRISWTVAIGLGTLLGLCFANCGQDNRSEAQTVIDVPCNATLLAAGTLEATDSEAAVGYYSIGAFTVIAPPGGIPAYNLKGLKGQRIEILIRHVGPRMLQEIKR